MMKVIIAPDSFKGTFSSKEIIEYLRKGFSQYFPDAEIVGIPIADGGEGTVEAILASVKGIYLKAVTQGPLGQPVHNGFGMSGETGFIEMASTSGITLVDKSARNPLYTSTYGTGELIKHALDQGVKKILIGIGGSATNDGGMGMAMALGAKFLDHKGSEVGIGGIDLGKIHEIDLSGLDPRLKSTDIQVICDVSNPLCGPEGATFTYGPQKGGKDWELQALEAGMRHYHHLIEKEFHISLNDIPGSGAAGGLGGGLVAFCGAKLKKGIEAMLDLVDYDQLVKDVDLIITGEGQLDGQSLYGKVPVGVAARSQNKPVIAFVGGCGYGYDAVYSYGIDAVFPVVDRLMSFEDMVLEKEKMMTDSIDRLMRFLKLSIGSC